MSDQRLAVILQLIQEDVGGRGLRTDPSANLITACAQDLGAAAHNLAAASRGHLGIITGFFIPHATPPAGETDGPLGAVFLARALLPLGIRVCLAGDPFVIPALQAGLKACGLGGDIGVHTLTETGHLLQDFPAALTHLLAIERVGPSHTLQSLSAQEGHTADDLRAFQQQVPPEHRDRCHNMRGVDISNWTCPVQAYFDRPATERPYSTIGIGDGGNEIGMGKIPWRVIRANIPGGERIACRVPTDFLIVAGVSNWGAYGLAAAVYLARDTTPPAELFDPSAEAAVLQAMVENGPLVDGTTGKPTLSVDGLDFDRSAQILKQLRAALG